MSKKLITLSVSLIAATTLVFGQQKDDAKKVSDTINNLTEVIVTANKIEQKQNTTGKVVTVINAAALQANAGRSLAQVLTEQTSLYLPGALSNAGTVPSIFMRGASSGRTLILIDGVPVGDPSMISNEFDLNLVPLDQVERVEILKGAQSTIYGSDAIGGVINIITKTKLKKSWSGSYSVGSYGTQKMDIQHAQTFNKLSYTIGYENQSAKGFSSALDKTNIGNFDKDGYQNKSWFANINYAINSNWNLKAYTRLTAYSADIDQAAFKDDKDNQFKNATKMTGITLKYKKDRTSFQLQYQINTQDRQYLNDSTDRTYTIFEDNHYWGTSHFADVFYANVFTKNIQWVVGSDFRYGSFHQTYESLGEWGPYNFNFVDTFQYQNAVYTSLILNDNANKWNIEIGGRYNKHSSYGNNQTFTLSPSFKVTNSVRLLASVSSGFKAPSLYQLSNNANLSPEESVSTEIGAEYKTNELFARAIYYNRTIDNGIDYNYIDYNYFNFIQQKVNGIELEFNWKLNTKNSINANYTLMNGKETNQNRVTTTDTVTYNYLLKRPKHSAGIQWQYNPTPKLAISVAARYISKRYDVGGYASPDVQLGYYILTNAHVQYKASKRLTLFADGQNLGNDRFQEVNGYNTIGRTLLFGIRLH